MEYEYSPLNIREPTREEVVAISSLVVAFTIARYSFQYGVKRALQKSDLVPFDKQQKFSESAWKALYYATTWIWAVIVVCSQDFFWNTKLCWTKETKMEDGFRYLFLFQLGFYLHSLIAHVTFETKRKDYTQMLVHHIVTSFLIGLSYYYGFAFIGGVLFVLFDLCDVILETGKMSLYAGKKKTSDSIFVLLITCWLGLRLVLYPMKVLYSASVESISIMDINTIPNGYNLYVLFVGMLFMIQLLNMYWFWLMIRILLRVIMGKGAADTREEDDD